MYLETFKLPIDEESEIVSAVMVNNGGMYGYIDNAYPCCIFSNKELREINFTPITILYGGNGSGKSTLLNLIANKLELGRVAPYNSSETFNVYTEACSYVLGFDDDGKKLKIPNGSCIITSDDVFDYMLAIRSNNDEIAESKLQAKEDWGELKYGETIKLNGMENFERFRLQVLARKKSLSRRKFIRQTAGSEVKLNSNGETAISYFNSKLNNDTLYCLDEPENSLSPEMQLALADLLYKKARYCGCQFIIATHSPFLLAIENARIYDLDAFPVDIKKWWELKNSKTYFEFFYKWKDYFLK